MKTNAKIRILFSYWLLAMSWFALCGVLAAATPPGTGLVLWLDATDMDGDGQPDSTANGVAVTLWTDKSGNGNDATATGALTYDATGLNSRPAVTFDGSSYFTTASGGESLHDAFTMFVVFENDGLNQYDTAVEWGNEAGGQRRGMMRFPNNGGILTFNGYGADVNSASPVAADQNYIAVITKATGLNGLITVYNNGTQVASGTAPLNDFASAAIKIGANNDGNEQWNGHIAEVLIYSRELSAQELNQAGLYLKTKYGVAADYADLRWGQQPQSLMAYAGEAHSLVGAAVGDEPIGYQWYKDGGLLNGATSTTLDFPSLQAPNAGSYFLVASSAGQTITSQVARVVVRTPADGGLLARWTFDDGTARDVYGFMDGTLYGTATIVDGRLQLSGSSGANRMEAPLGVPLGVNKTLVAWFTLSSLTPNNTAGGPLAVQDGSASFFDSITYGERTAGQWMNGSDFWRRTPADNGGAIETLVEPDEIMMAITYDETAANKIKLYRNGVLYAEHNQGALQSFAVGGKVLIGPRLAQYGYMDGYVNEARLYDRALSPVEIGALTGRPLFIWSQPRSQIALVGETVTFIVGAGGAEPLFFQWLKDGVPIAGRTATNLVLTDVQTTAAGGYSLVVSNSSGAITSAVAQLEVSLPRNPVTSDLALWLDAGDMDGDGQPDATADGTAVTLWTDKSGIGNDATATGTLTYAPGGLNGRPAVTYDGSAFFRTVSGGESLHEGFTMFVVFENDGRSEYDTALEWGNEANGQRRGMMRFPSGVLTFNGYGADLNSSTQVASDQGYIAAITKGPALNALIRVYLNGPQVAAGAAALTDFSAPEITVGANNGGGEQWNGHIAEVLVYSRELSAQELNATGNYLKFKYGMSASYTDLGLILQPQSQTALVGAKITLSALAIGLEPLQYQWFKGASPLAGASSPDLVSGPVQLSDAGDYFVVVNNPAGSVTSVVAHVAVSLPRTPVTSDLVLWLDATDMDGDGQPEGTAAGSAVTSWTDKSGIGNDAMATGLLTYAPDGLNGRPAVTYDGSAFFNTLSGGESLHEGFTMYVVFENDGRSEYDTALEWGNEANGQRRGMMRFPSGVLTFNGYNADVNSSTQVASDQGYIAAITKGPALSALIRVYRNGTQVASGTAALADYSSAAIMVGANNGGGEQWNGHIAEVLVYSRELSAQELNENGLYLALKYGLAAAYVVPPTLAIAHTGSQVSVSWPAPGPGWVLESADALPAASWTAVPGVVNNSVTVEATAGPRFYRMRYQP